jgi:hypothetical protein
MPAVRRSIDMTGSTEAAVVIPIVAFVVLFFWLGMVFWADSHPRWGNSEVPGPAGPRQAVLPEGSSIPRPRVEGPGVPQQPARQDSAEQGTRQRGGR